MRKFAKVTLISEKDFASGTAHLNDIGPDPLAKEFTFAVFKKQLEQRPTGRIKNVLSELKKKKINMIIISSGVQKKLDKEVKDYGLNSFFQEVNGGVHNKAEEIHKILHIDPKIPKSLAGLDELKEEYETIDADYPSLYRLLKDNF